MSHSETVAYWAHVCSFFSGGSPNVEKLRPLIALECCMSHWVKPVVQALSCRSPLFPVKPWGLFLLVRCISLYLLHARHSKEAMPITDPMESYSVHHHVLSPGDSHGCRGSKLITQTDGGGLHCGGRTHWRGGCPSVLQVMNRGIGNLVLGIF